MDEILVQKTFSADACRVRRGKMVRTSEGTENHDSVRAIGGEGSDARGGRSVDPSDGPGRNDADSRGGPVGRTDRARSRGRYCRSRYRPAEVGDRSGKRPFYRTIK